MLLEGMRYQSQPSNPSRLELNQNKHSAGNISVKTGKTLQSTVSKVAENFHLNLKISAEKFKLFQIVHTICTKDF